MTGSAIEAALHFRRLHDSGLLLLPNAWDAGSARLLESLGAPAIATSSAAVAWSHGYPDGDRLPGALLAATASAIARIVRVPLSVDIEGGYSDDPTEVGEAVALVVDAGAVGINLEDGTASPDLLCAKIEAAKRSAARRGVDLFVNARADVYLRALVPADRRVSETLARAERYRSAGADGLFAPGVSHAAEIRAIASGQKLPLNVLVWAGLPPAEELASLGVRRLSAGSSICQVVYGRIASLATGFLATGASAPLLERSLNYSDLNALFAAH
ncbi:MAG: isocitrate lyase/phosphoenolpyruvate mutase family protein [Myxococcaceae bacterium]